MDCLSEAVRVFTEERRGWLAMQRAGMRRDFSWGRAAGQYEQVRGAGGVGEGGGCRRLSGYKAGWWG